MILLPVTVIYAQLRNIINQMIVRSPSNLRSMDRVCSRSEYPLHKNLGAVLCFYHEAKYNSVLLYMLKDIFILIKTEFGVFHRTKETGPPSISAGLKSVKLSNSSLVTP